MAAEDVSNPSMQLDDHVFTKTFRQQMVQLRKAKQHTDVILNADGVDLHCHQVALSAGSRYFNAMFASDCTESKSGVVAITDISSGTLESVVDYIYTGQIQITIENAQQFVQASDLYHLDTLKKTCENFMVDHLEAQNCLGFNRLAQMYRLNDLIKESRDYMLNHFKDCVLGPEFKEVTEEELVEYIKDDHLDVKDENPVFEAVLDWLKHDVDGRRTKLLSILKHVRVCYCSQRYLSHIVVEDTVAKDPDLVNYILKAWKDQTTFDSAGQIPRQSYPAKRCLVLVGGVGEADKVIANEHCSYFDEDCHTWKRLATMPSPRDTFFSVCKFNQQLLMTGGSPRTNSCWILDTTRKEWKQFPPLNVGRYLHSSTEHGGKAYVIGGRSDAEQNENVATSSVEMFCGIRQKWLPTQPLITAVVSPMVASSGLHVYCFGGSTGAKGEPQSRQTQVYDTVWEAWSERAEMPKGCIGGSVITLAEQIFVLGGFSKICMSYSPGTDQWSLLTQPSAQHAYAPAIVWRGRVVLAGGNGSKMIPTSLIEEYNPDTDTWEAWTTSLDWKQSSHYLLDIDIPALTN